MAISSKDANNFLRTTATNTLGRLGNSIFNSSIGTLADPSTMNQIYKAMDGLMSTVDAYVDEPLAVEAINGRNEGEKLFDLIAGMNIKKMKEMGNKSISANFMNASNEFMERLMRINRNEKNITLDAIGFDTTGFSDVIRNEYAVEYPYTEGNNYISDYVSTLAPNQAIGDETTMRSLETADHWNYSGIHNDLYAVSQNLYPDENNTGSFANKWITENQNSLLYKTKKLYNSKKINTIISSFHTDPSKRPSLLDNARSKYGLSHGRNLLTKRAESGYNTYYANGYDNPYCRAWTHHHQYDRYYKTMRPFSSVDDNGNYQDTLSVNDFHKWEQFADYRDNNEATVGKWGWKKDSNNGWQYSVLQDNGKVNITPKFVNGGSSNIHTKQCMFSIENLAWRGYDPYSFEQALSWEQRGPLGGRIMWFPPYGIQFQETTTAQWNNLTFVGRGENVYTYSNTTRTGNLSFMMVVDHPSIIDYVTWTNQNKNVSDTDILRFFAGCEEGNGKGLRELAKPTPLTDEYTQIHATAFAAQEVIEAAVTGDESTDPDGDAPIPDSICFYVFYPNNYSGTYDDNYLEGELGEGSKKVGGGTSLVDPILYLLMGKGAQKDNTTPQWDNNLQPFADDLILNEDRLENTENGYEMHTGGLGIGGGTIWGTNQYSNSSSGFWLNVKGTPQYVGKDNKKWWYRIDGQYKIPTTDNEKIINYYNQTLDESKRKDTESLGLNCSIKAVKQNKDEVKEVSDDNTKYYSLNGQPNIKVYTLAEIAYVLYGQNENIRQKLGQLKLDKSRIDTLQNQLNDNSIKQIKSINAVGYASDKGYKKSNIELGKNRAKTAAHWVKKKLGLTNSEIQVGYEPQSENNIGPTDSTQSQKAWRYARVIIEFGTSESTDAAGVEGNNDTSPTNENTPNTDNGFNFILRSVVARENIQGKDAPQNPSFNEDSDIQSSNKLIFDNAEEIKVLQILPFNVDNGGLKYEVFNYTSVQNNTRKIQIKQSGEENATFQEFTSKRLISFSFTDECEQEHACVIYDYGDYIDLAMDGYEDVFDIKIPADDGDNITDRLDFKFIITEPIKKWQGIQFVNSTITNDRLIESSNMNVNIRCIEYDKENKMLKISFSDKTSLSMAISIAEQNLQNTNGGVGEMVEELNCYCEDMYTFTTSQNEKCVIGLCTISTNETSNKEQEQDLNPTKIYGVYLDTNKLKLCNYYYKSFKGNELGNTDVLEIQCNNQPLIRLTKDTIAVNFDYGMIKKIWDKVVVTEDDEGNLMGKYDVTSETIFKLNNVLGIKEVGDVKINTDEKKISFRITDERFKDAVTIGGNQPKWQAYITIAEDMNSCTFSVIANGAWGNSNSCFKTIKETIQKAQIFLNDKKESLQELFGTLEEWNSKPTEQQSRMILYGDEEGQTPAVETPTTTPEGEGNSPSNSTTPPDEGQGENQNGEGNQNTTNDDSNGGDNSQVVEMGQILNHNYVGYSPTGEKGTYDGKEYPIYKDKNGKTWYRVTDGRNKIAKFISVGYANEEDITPMARYGNGKSDENRLRYDQEYHFFKVLEKTDPVVFNSLMDKLQYFDPAFHSMTPEGFNGRLTFLQQCMRQGNTVTASDGKYSKNANNMAFGRAPYCVLRLGDFYNQMIIINSLSINYDPLVWDLNVEGVGVQPLIAHVQLSFTFIGGGDLTGPVRRLQNAMSFNYYANARLYDNRADRMERMWSDKTNGAIEHDEIFSTDGWTQRKKDTYASGNNISQVYTTQMYK